MTLYIVPLRLTKQSQDVAAVGVEKQRHKDVETDVLRDAHKLLAWLAACDNLPKGEQHVTTIKHRNRQ